LGRDVSLPAVGREILEGVLTWHDIKFKRTHDLAEIGAQCAVVDSTLASVAREAEPLSQYAWQFRYPGESDDPNRSQAKEALHLAKKVFQETILRLPKEAHPSINKKLRKKIKNQRGAKKKSGGSRKK
jgi:HEPN domain